MRSPIGFRRTGGVADLRAQALVDLLGTAAARKNATVAQIALARLFVQQPWIVPNPGTRRLERLQENLDAADVEFTTDNLHEIETAAAKIEVRVATPAGTWSG